MIGLSDDGDGWELILASGSPRRRDLLREAGFSFRVISPEVDEQGEEAGVVPRDLAAWNARLKCFAVAMMEPEAWVIGADTVVAMDGRVYGKPESREEAAENLRSFRGRVHEVMTGVVITKGENLVEFVETSFVKFRDFGDEVIEEYLTKVEVADKAGGYAIQDCGEMLVERFEGSLSNIVGLPMEAVLKHLGKMGFPLPRLEKR